MKTCLLSQQYNQYASLHQKKWKVGSNTGNILFMTALRNIIKCDIVAPEAIDTLKDYDSIVTPHLIWIREIDEPSEQKLKLLDLNAKLIPITVGLQAKKFDPDFALKPTMIRYLQRVAERATLSVRGTYTAEILDKHGIGNVEVLGCPSVYQLPLYADGLNLLNRDFRRDQTVANHRSLHGNLTPKEIALLGYMMEHDSDFIEQTLTPLSKTNVEDKNLFDWMEGRSFLFFDQESWVRHMARYSFSYGLRFHGNVAAMLAGIPALFITLDSRTQELTNFFGMPTINIDEFDRDRPIETYREMADFSTFNRKYPDKLSRFIDYIESNGMSIRESFAKKLEIFRME